MRINFVKATICMMTCLIMAGCVSTMRGTPNKPFSSKLVTDEDVIKTAVEELSRGAHDGRDAISEKNRNEKISILLSAVDANYFEFRKDVFANSRHSSASSGMLTLLMTIAGGLTGSAGVKQHYLLGTNLVNGVSTQFQKSYLYEKNIGSLVATMDADRDKVLDGILSAIEARDYRGQTALLDIYNYFIAGTLENAVASLEQKTLAEAKKNAGLVRNRSLSNALNTIEAAADKKRAERDSASED